MGIGVFFLLLLLLLGGCSAVKEPSDTPETLQREFSLHPAAELPADGVLTLTKAQEIALKNNPTCQAAAVSVQAARYGYLRSWSTYFPEITVSSSVGQALERGYDLHHPPAGIAPRKNRFDTSGNIEATLLLFDGLEREINTLIAAEEYDRSAAVNENIRRLLLRSVAYTYWDILLACAESRIARADLFFQESALLQAERQFAAGHVSKAAVLNFKLLAAKAQSDILFADYRAGIGKSALMALLGFGQDAAFPELVLPEPDEIVIENRPLEFFMEQAIRNRPDLEELLIERKISRYRVKQVYAAFLPKIHLFAGFSAGSNAAAYGGYTYSHSYYNLTDFSYGIHGEWNLFRGLDSVRELQQRKKLEKVADWEVRSKLLEIFSEVKDACLNCQNAAEQLKIFQEMVKWVQEQRDLVFSEYTNGRETITRLNEAQSILVETENRLAQIRFMQQKAAAQLYAAIGLQ